MNAKKRPSLVAGALVAVVVLVGCSRGPVEHRSAPAPDDAPAVTAWNGEPYDQAVHDLGQPSRDGNRVRWYCSGHLTLARVDEGLLVDVALTYYPVERWAELEASQTC